MYSTYEQYQSAGGKLSEEVYGSMLLGIPAGQYERALKFLSGIENVQAEEVTPNV